MDLLHPTARVPANPAPRPRRLFEAPDWIWSRSGEFGWWVRPDWRERILGDQGLKLDEWRRLGRLTTIKTGPHRVVYRVDLAEGAIYIKHFLVPDLRAMARQWFRRGKGRNEGRRAIKLASIGIQTIDPIALGEQRKRAFLFENYLITQAIPETVPLDEFVEQHLPKLTGVRGARVRRELAVALADLTVHLHEAGFIHQDFHPGNLLIRFDEDDRPHLSVIDLDALRKTSHLSWRAARKNLSLLNHYFWSRSSRADRYRFLDAYLVARKADPSRRRWFALEIERSTRSWAERLWRRWGRRCHRSNKYFKKLRGEKVWAIASRDLDREVVRRIMAEPRAALDGPGVTILKDSRTTTVAELSLPVRNAPRPVILKQFHPKKRFEWLLNLLRPTRAWRSWQAGQHLLSRGIPTPQNLAIIVKTASPLPIPLETYLLTIKSDRARTLGQYILDELSGLPFEPRRAAIRSTTKALGKLLKLMHERSISDRDLKSSNILIEGDPAVEPPRLSLIDLVGVQLCDPLPRHRRLQNLARLQLSLEDVPGRTRTDTLRFLKAYLTWGLAPRDDWKGLWREVGRLSEKKRERNRVRGRLLS